MNRVLLAVARSQGMTTRELRIACGPGDRKVIAAEIREAERSGRIKNTGLPNRAAWVLVASAIQHAEHAPQTDDCAPVDIFPSSLTQRALKRLTA